MLRPLLKQKGLIMIVRINGNAYELAEKAELKTELKTEFLALMFPVGYVMILATNINPNHTIGGTWQKIKSGKFLEATENDGELKNEVLPGLPNIYGELGLDDMISHVLSGAIQNTGKHFNYDANSKFSGNGIYAAINASLSSPIYGRSSTVQPSSIKVAMWIRVA